MSTRGRKSGEWATTLEAWLEVRRSAQDLREPIPPTRELAERYTVNHTSVFRLLQRLQGEGKLWKAPNGRFYFSEARPLIEKPRPIACLFRRIENWSLLYQELMEGIADECESRSLASLLWHDDQLVQHPHPARPPVFADVNRQKLSLARFAERYGAGIGGIILDHAWHDEAVASLPAELHRLAVVLCRPGTANIPGLLPDFSAAAGLAFTHLFAQGYQRIHPVRPFRHDPSVDHTLACVLSAAAGFGLGGQLGGLLEADTPARRARLIKSLARNRVRVGLIFPEDNVAALFHEECRRAELPCPEKIGILSLQGTRAAVEGGLTHTRTSYHDLGKQAVALGLGLVSPAPPFLPPRLAVGRTTGPG